MLYNDLSVLRAVSSLGDKQMIWIVNGKRSGPVLQNVRRLERARNCGGERDGVEGLAHRHKPDGPELDTDRGREFFVV
jgi:hypothetical protein